MTENIYPESQELFLYESAFYLLTVVHYTLVGAQIDVIICIFFGFHDLICFCCFSAYCKFVTSFYCLDRVKKRLFEKLGKS